MLCFLGCHSTVVAMQQYSLSSSSSLCLISTANVPQEHICNTLFPSPLCSRTLLAFGFVTLLATAKPGGLSLPPALSLGLNGARKLSYFLSTY